MDGRDRIRRFILDHVEETELADDDDIFDRGLVRSMFVMELVLFVEQEFGISVSGEDLTFDAFRSVDAINELVARRVAT